MLYALIRCMLKSLVYILVYTSILYGYTYAFVGENVCICEIMHMEVMFNENLRKFFEIIYAMLVGTNTIPGCNEYPLQNSHTAR